jgi:hypothetical protein
MSRRRVTTTSRATLNNYSTKNLRNRISSSSFCSAPASSSFTATPTPTPTTRTRTRTFPTFQTAKKIDSKQQKDDPLQLKPYNMNISAGGSYYEKARSRRERHRLVLMQQQQTDNVIPLGRRGVDRGLGGTSLSTKEEEDDDDPGLRAIRKSTKLVQSRRLLSTITKARSAKPVTVPATTKRARKYKHSSSTTKVVRRTVL